jgi:hypothetical protein
MALFLDARIFAECWKPFGKAQQICSEGIEITSLQRTSPKSPSFWCLASAGSSGGAVVPRNQRMEPGRSNSVSAGR